MFQAEVVCGCLLRLGLVVLSAGASLPLAICIGLALVGFLRGGQVFDALKGAVQELETLQQYPDHRLANSAQQAATTKITKTTKQNRGLTDGGIVVT